MKSFVVCAILLAFVAVSAQAGAVKTRLNDLEYSCDVKGIMTLAETVVTDSIAVVFDLRADLEGVSTSVMSCVKNNLMNPEKLVNCVVSDTESEASAAYNTLEQYLSDLQSLVKQIKSKLNQCTKL